MWRQPFLAWKEEVLLIDGFDQIIKEAWPQLELYFTMKGWVRKKAYA